MRVATAVHKKTSKIHFYTNFVGKLTDDLFLKNSIT